MVNRHKIKYITDSKGKKKDVILSIKDYNNLIEDLNDLAVVAERRNEKTITHKSLVKKIRNVY